jgi:hypothetical protein
MKKLIAALVLATSFAAFADDAAKTDAPKSAKKAKKAKKSAKEAPPPVRRPSRLPRSNSSAVRGDRGRAMGRVARDERVARPVVVPALRSARLVRILGLLDGGPRIDGVVQVQVQVLVLGAGVLLVHARGLEALHVVRLEVRRVRVVLEIRRHPEIVVVHVEPIALDLAWIEVGVGHQLRLGRGIAVNGELTENVHRMRSGRSPSSGVLSTSSS